MADDRVIQCLFEKKPRLSNRRSKPLEENPPYVYKIAHSQKRKCNDGIETYSSSKETSHSKNHCLSSIYIQRQKRANKQVKNYPLLRNKHGSFIPLTLNSMGDLKVASHYSTPEISKSIDIKIKKTCSNLTQRKNKHWRIKTSFTVNTCCCDRNVYRKTVDPLVYRCQPSKSRQVCCCNCNSDAMFEVMKSLYDCYKNKNCHNCRCVLCGPKFRGETVSIGVGVGETYLEHKYAPIEGKTPSQKERAIRKMATEGISLPKGRTPSEEELILKVKRSIAIITPKMPTEKIRKARAAGLLTPLEGKTSRDKERILRGLAAAGMPLPVAKTASDRRLIEKVKKDMGLPPEAKSKTQKKIIEKAYTDGIITPLEGKTTVQKERALRRMAEAGVPLPEGRTHSEKGLIKRIKKETHRVPSEVRMPSEKIRKAKAEGLFTPLVDKTDKEKERILRGLAKVGLPLPEAKTHSEKRLIDNIRKDMGLPREPQTESEKKKMAKGYEEGIITPLEGKTTAQKEHVLRRMAEAGIPLPEGRTTSEKSLIKKIKTAVPRIPSEKLHKARTEGLLTPLEGKSKSEKEMILRGMAKAGMPLPEGKTASQRRLIQKVKRDLGLPPEPKTKSEEIRISRAFAEGIITPLEGKSHAEKEKILRKMAVAGIPLPEGRTTSERDLIEKVQQSLSIALPKIPSENIRKARAEGLLTPLEGKSDKEKENILRKLAEAGMPLPEPKTVSERRLIDKVRRDMGLPTKPKTKLEKKNFAKAYADGIITPLEGKTTAQKEKTLHRMVEAGIPLPEGRTLSEKELIDKFKKTARRMPSKVRRVRDEGLLSPLDGKTHKEKERIIRGLADAGIPLPEAKTQSEKKLIEYIRKDIGLPPEPETEREKKKMEKAYEDGIITPLEGKTKVQKERVLRRMVEAGIPLPEGRTASEKALIKKIKNTVPRIPLEKLHRAQTEGLLTPLENKSHAEKERILRGMAKAGVPLPEAKTSSEVKLIQKIRRNMGLPPEPVTPSEKVRLSRAYAAGIITPLEGKSPSEKEHLVRRMAAEGVPLPEGRTASEKVLINKIKKEAGQDMKPRVPTDKLKAAKAKGLLTPIKGKTTAEKERILRGLAQHGIPLPEGKTTSEKRLLKKVKIDMGLPPDPETPTEKENMARAYAAGIVTPLEGKSYQEKESALRRMADAGVPLPEGRTVSEKALIQNILATTAKVPSEKLRKAQAEGLLTPLKGKTHQEKERILRGLTKAGLPLPEGKTQSEKDLIDKVRKDMGLPRQPKTSSEKERIKRAYSRGLVTPLEGKTMAQKEKALKKMAEVGVPLPEGRTASEKALIKKVKATTAKISSEKLRRAQAKGLLTPIERKTPQEKERILRGLAKDGMPLPEGKTQSEKDLIEKIRRDFGLPPQPRRSSEKIRMAKAYADGVITPLEGKTMSEKEKALHRMAKAGITLPEGRTSSERALIKEIKAKTPKSKIRKAKAEGLLTPLEGKTKEEREHILKELAKAGLPLPEGKSPSENKLIQKLRREIGLPPEPTTPAEKVKLSRAYAAGLITPLEGKPPAEKEQILRNLVEANIPLPEGRTASEKALINKVIQQKRKQSIPRIPEEKLRKARAAGLLTPLEGKSDKEREKILKKIAKAGLPLPKGHSPSEQKLIEKVRWDMGLPPEPKTSSQRIIQAKQYAAGVITPLEGKNKNQKKVILKKMAKAGVELPIGRTPSEKALIEDLKKHPTKARPALPSKKREKLEKGTAKAIKESLGPSEECICDLLTPESERDLKVLSGKLRLAKADGLLTPLEGKSSDEKEKILRGLAERGLPLPTGKTESQKRLAEKVKKEMGLPPTPKTEGEKEKLARAYATGIVTPLEGKSRQEKERVLRRMAKAGVPLPEGRTHSERALIQKVQDTTVQVPSEKLRRPKAEGLLTPLEGKTQEQKEEILRELAKAGVPLPKAKTTSEKYLINKVKRDMGLPPEPKSSAEKKRIKKAYKSGIITPLEGKTHEEKEKILRKMAEAGVPLPEGRTASEKSLIKQLNARYIKIPPKKLRQAETEGLLISLDGKTTKEKEQILKGLIKAGIPPPEGKTQSERNLIEKVRRDMGLPPRPTTSSEKDRMAKAYATGMITPLEDKTHAEKEKALQKMAEAGVLLPEGRTRSERELIAKIKAKTPRVPPDKLRRAKEEGVLTSLEEKPKDEKERILRGLARAGVPLPKGKTASDHKLIEKVRREMGLPPEPLSASERTNLSKAYAAGIITPLEGKSHAEKEQALRRMAAVGVPLPQGRTVSEKDIIDKIKKETKQKGRIEKMPSEKLRAAKAKGLFTPLEGKSQEDKEKILRGLAKAGMPLPTAQSPSENKLIQKIRRDMGLPPTPRTLEEKKKMTKAYADGIITPLEGKSTADKERALQKMAKAGVPLPEGRTESEKALISKVRDTTKYVPSDILRKAKREGLLTPLEGKSPEEKEKILKGLAKAGIPLPIGKTTSDKNLIQKVRRDLGLPDEPSNSKEQRAIDKGYAKGIITPLEGKTTSEKEKILIKMQKVGIPLPEGRTASEKALVGKVKKTTPIEIQSEQLRRAEDVGLLTPLKGKTDKEKEQILRGLAKAGMPLPAGKTSSERNLIQNVRKDMGLPPEPATSKEKEKMNKAYAAGIITPLEGKTHDEKEKVLHRLAEAGLPLPDGRTPSERKLIDEIEKRTVAAPPSDKARAARTAGLLTPLEEKSAAEKEKILKGLAKAGVPLPEGRTSSERKLINKVRKDLGLPPEPKSSGEKIKMAGAYAQGIITPLQGKTMAQKEKILRKLAEAGIPLPKGRTKSERFLIDKVRAEYGGGHPSSLQRKTRKIMTEGKGPSEERVLSPYEKIQRAKDKGLMTPLEGKSDAERERILRGLAKEGLPLPEAKTLSERKLIQKVIKDMGLPPKPKTSAETRKFEKAYAAGIITPLEGKTAAEKEQALIKMQKVGIELPEGRTSSEKALIEKIKRQRPLQTISRGVTVTEQKARAGITEDIEEIVKLDKCDRACGCDRKKIRFKHSYIKIRVTSPDISSFCSCPDECVPGVKGGVFVDNEGIKVTVGRVTGTPSYTPSSGSIKTDLSVPSLFDPISSSSSSATISSYYNNNMTDDTDVCSNDVFDVNISTTAISLGATHSDYHSKDVSKIISQIFSIKSNTSNSLSYLCSLIDTKTKNSEQSSNVILDTCAMPLKSFIQLHSSLTEQASNAELNTCTQPLKSLIWLFSAPCEQASAAELNTCAVPSKSLIQLHLSPSEQASNAGLNTCAIPSTSLIQLFSSPYEQASAAELNTCAVPSKSLIQLHLSPSEHASNAGLNTCAIPSTSLIQLFSSPYEQASAAELNTCAVPSKSLIQLHLSPSEQASIAELNTYAQPSKSLIELLSARTFGTNSSSYDSVIILLTDSSSNSYINELGTISVMSFESANYTSVNQCPVSKRNRDVSHDIDADESDRFKRSIDYTIETKTSNASCVQHYYLKEGSHNVTQNNYLEICTSHTTYNKVYETDIQPLFKNKLNKNNDLIKVMKEILSQQHFSDTSSVCVIISESEDSVARIQRPLTYREHKLPYHTRDFKPVHFKSPAPGRYEDEKRLKNDDFRTPPRAKDTRKSGIENKNNIGKHSTNPKVTNVEKTTSFGKVDRKRKLRKNDDAHSHTSRSPKRHGVDINIRDAHAQHQSVFRFDKKPICTDDQFKSTLNKLKMMIYADQLDRSITSLDGVFVQTTNKPVYKKQDIPYKSVNIQVPDALNVFMQEDSSSSSQDSHVEYSSPHSISNRPCGKANYIPHQKDKKMKQITEGCQVNLCKRCNPREQQSEVRNSKSPNRQCQCKKRKGHKNDVSKSSQVKFNIQHLEKVDAKLSALSTSVYHQTLVDHGIQGGNVNQSCSCSPNSGKNTTGAGTQADFDGFVIVFKPKIQSSNVDEKSCGRGYMLQIDSDFVKEYQTKTSRLQDAACCTDRGYIKTVDEGLCLPFKKDGGTCPCGVQANVGGGVQGCTERGVQGNVGGLLGPQPPLQPPGGGTCPCGVQANVGGGVQGYTGGGVQGHVGGLLGPQQPLQPPDGGTCPCGVQANIGNGVQGNVGGLLGPQQPLQPPGLKKPPKPKKQPKVECECSKGPIPPMSTLSPGQQNQITQTMNPQNTTGQQNQNTQSLNPQNTYLNCSCGNQQQQQMQRRKPPPPQYELPKQCNQACRGQNDSFTPSHKPCPYRAQQPKPKECTKCKPVEVRCPNRLAQNNDACIGPDCKYGENVPPVPPDCVCPLPPPPIQTAQANDYCVCPDPNHVYTYDDLFWMDKKDIMKLKSDLAKAKGIKITKKPKKIECDLSIEEAIQFYKKQAEEDLKEACSCDSVLIIQQSQHCFNRTAHNESNSKSTSKKKVHKKKRQKDETADCDCPLLMVKARRGLKELKCKPTTVYSIPSAISNGFPAAVCNKNSDSTVSGSISCFISSKVLTEEPVPKTINCQYSDSDSTVYVAYR